MWNYNYEVGIHNKKEEWIYWTIEEGSQTIGVSEIPKLKVNNNLILKLYWVFISYSSFMKLYLESRDD